VKREQRFRQVFHVRARERSGRLGERVEQVVLFEAPHDDDPVDRLAVAVERQGAVRRPRDGRDFEIDIGRGAAVERQLLFAGKFARFGIGEIDIGQFNRAFELVDAIPGEKNARDMGLDDLDLGRDAVGVGPAQKRDRALLCLFAHAIHADPGRRCLI